MLRGLHCGKPAAEEPDMHRTTGAWLLALAILAAGSGPATAASVGAVELKYEKFKLANGLDVILHQDHRLPLVAVNVWYHVGPANETAGRTGFAHLFEHMMFEGSKHVGSKAHFRFLEAAGASDANGTTDFDRTNYFETLPSNQLELALWLESDRMGYLLEGLDSVRLENQRDVVRNERRQSIEGAPYGLAEEEIFHQLFPVGHPYHADVMGSHEDIEAARIDDVRTFSREYYTPSNASLVIAGDIEFATARRLVEKYFGTIPAGRAVPSPAALTPPITTERRVVVADQVELPRVYMAWIMDPIFQPGDAESDVIAQVLGGGRSGRLYKALVHERQVALDVTVQTQNLRLGSVLMLEATAKPGVDAARLEAAIDEQLDRFRTEGPSAGELERARNVIETKMLGQLERLGGFGGVADQLNLYNQFLNDPGFLARDLGRYDAATPATVKRTAQARLQRSARVVVYCVPGEKVLHDVPRAASVAATTAGGSMPEEPWRAAVPPPGAVPGISLPVAAQFKLDNGLTVLVVEQHQLPVVAASVVTFAGTSANPVDRPGLAAFTAEMLQEGTLRRSAAQLADDAAQAGANLGTQSGRDRAIATLTVLKPNLRPALELLADVVGHPRFDAKDVERVRSLRDGELQQATRDPREASRVVLLHALYGGGQRYGYPDAGTRAGNRRVSVLDLKRLWRQHYLPATTALVLAGDVTPAEARSLAATAFGEWRSVANKGAEPPPVHFEPGARMLLLDRPGSPQSMIRLGLPGVARSTPDYAALEVMNNVFGGLFSSRLNMNLREEHGYTYGAGSAFRFGREAGYFTASSGIRTDVSAPGLEAFLKELDAMRTVPPTEAELKGAQASFAQSLAGLFETPEQTSQTVADLFVYGLPADTYAGLPAQVYAVTGERVTALAGRYLDPASLKIVIVGDRAKIEQSIRALGPRRLELVGDDGGPVAKH